MTAGVTTTLDPAASRATFDIANPALESLERQPDKTAADGLVRDVRQYGHPRRPRRSGLDRVRLLAGHFKWLLQRNILRASSRVSRTPTSEIPTSGSATYAGSTVGLVYVGGSQGIGDVLTGDVSLVKQLHRPDGDGPLSNMLAGDPWYAGAAEWNSVSLSASFTGGQSRFAGTTAATSAPGTFYHPGPVRPAWKGSFFGVPTPKRSAPFGCFLTAPMREPVRSARRGLRGLRLLQERGVSRRLKRWRGLLR